MDENFNGGNIFIGNKKLAEAVSKMDFKNPNPSVNLSSATMVKPNPAGEIQKIMADTRLSLIYLK